MPYAIRTSALILLALAPATAVAEPQSVMFLGSPSARVERALRDALSRRSLGLRAPPPLGAAEPHAAPLPTAPRLAEQTLESARKLYYEVQPARAATLLDQRLRESASAIAIAGRLDLLGALYLWRGVCLLKQAERSAAREAFSTAIVLGQGVPEEARFGPAVVRAWAEARWAISGADRVALSLEVIPEGARVLIDGHPFKKGARFALGSHWVVVEAPGFMPSARQVRLEAGATSTIRIALYPADRRTLRAQLQTLATRGELDPASPLVALGLCRWGETPEALAVLESGKGRTTELTLRRIDCNQGRTLGQHRETTTEAGMEDAVERALAHLWGASTAPLVRTRSSSPFYRRWWFWTLVGAAVVGGATAAIVVGTRGPGTYSLRVE